MKKLTIVLLLVCLVTFGAFAQNPSYFTFNVGALGTYDMPTKAIGNMETFGMQFQFDNTFSAGFSFAGTTTSLLNITASPIENTSVTMYTGTVAGNTGFGVGLGYDFLVKSDKLFSSMGIYIDWLASNVASGTAYSIRDGGNLAIGLKAKFGL